MPPETRRDPGPQRSGLFVRIVVAGLVLVSGGTDLAARTQADICDRAAQHAARATDVPLHVLRAITRVETGRSRAGRLEPWPWTVNMEGRGVWFESRKRALDYIDTHYRRGARSFDVGCFQINYRWHGDGFRSIDEMFDPQRNAIYAARFLETLYTEFGNWTRAVGAYHSRTELYAARYRDKFRQVLAALDTDTRGPGLTGPGLALIDLGQARRPQGASLAGAAPRPGAGGVPLVLFGGPTNR